MSCTDTACEHLGGPADECPGLRWWQKLEVERPRVEILSTLGDAMDAAVERAVETGRRQRVRIWPMYRWDGEADQVYGVEEREAS